MRTDGTDLQIQNGFFDPCKSVLSVVRSGFCARSVNDEWFRIRIIFKDGVIAGGYSGGIMYGSPQFKTDALPALPAKRKTSAFQQGGFVHQPVRGMSDPVNSTFRH